MIHENLEVLRRIAERGLSQAEYYQNNQIDLWNHLLSEIDMTRKAYEAEHADDIVGGRRWDDEA